VSSSETWMNTTISFVESFDYVMAKGQQFLVRTQGNTLDLRFMNFAVRTTLPANREVSIP